MIYQNKGIWAYILLISLMLFSSYGFIKAEKNIAYLSDPTKYTEQLNINFNVNTEDIKQFKICAKKEMSDLEKDVKECEKYLETFSENMTWFMIYFFIYLFCVAMLIILDKFITVLSEIHNIDRLIRNKKYSTKKIIKY